MLVHSTGLLLCSPLPESLIHVDEGWWSTVLWRMFFRLKKHCRPDFSAVFNKAGLKGSMTKCYNWRAWWKTMLSDVFGWKFFFSLQSAWISAFGLDLNKETFLGYLFVDVHCLSKKREKEKILYIKYWGSVQITISIFFVCHEVLAWRKCLAFSHRAR